MLMLHCRNAGSCHPWRTSVFAPKALFLLEMQPASYAILAANEAEKAANINILEVRAFGAFGRVYIGGEEKDVEVARPAVGGRGGRSVGRFSP